MTHGLNAPICRDIAWNLRHDADALADIAHQSAYAVRRITEDWDGPDSDEFAHRGTLCHHHLDAATHTLELMQQRLAAAIDEQESTSRL